MGGISCLNLAVGHPNTVQLLLLKHDADSTSGPIPFIFSAVLAWDLKSAHMLRTDFTVHRLLDRTRLDGDCCADTGEDEGI